MKISLNSLMKSYKYKSKKESPYFIMNSKISEINNISNLFTNYSNDKDKDKNSEKSFLPVTPALTMKPLPENKKLEISNISIIKNNINKNNNNEYSLKNLYKNKVNNFLNNNNNFKKNIKLRKFMFEKEKVKNISLEINHKKNNANKNKNKKISKSFLINKRNISSNSLNASNTTNKNSISKNKNSEKISLNNIKLKNNKKFLKGKKIKLLKMPYKFKNISNKYDILSHKDFYVHFSALLENIIRKKENEIDNNIKTTSNKHLLEKMYDNINLFNRKIKKIKKFTPILHEYHRDNTTSIENKKNLPYFYNKYVNKTKKIFTDLNNTYNELKKDITSDIIYNKKPKLEKRGRTVVKDLKYEELNNEVKEMKKDIGYEKPSIELFTDKSTSFQFLTSIFENLNKLNSNIAYKHRYYFAKKYDIDIKKDLLKIEVENEDYLFKFRKNLPH